MNERFWAKADKSGDCWLWTASLANGYGQFRIGRPPNRQMVRAHRLAWELTYGSIPEHLCVLHRCDNPICVNPEHLFLGTQADNIRDRVWKGRCADTRGEGNSGAKLAESDVLEIRRLGRAGHRHREIAEQFGVTPHQIGVIILRQQWAHI